jgi:hypothetical protein
MKWLWCAAAGGKKGSGGRGQAARAWQLAGEGTRRPARIQAKQAPYLRKRVPSSSASIRVPMVGAAEAVVVFLLERWSLSLQCKPIIWPLIIGCH